MTVSVTPAEGGTYNLTESGWHDPYVGTAIEGYILENDYTLTITPKIGWCIESVRARLYRSGELISDTITDSDILSVEKNYTEVRYVDGSSEENYDIEVVLRKRQCKIDFYWTKETDAIWISFDDIDITVNGQIVQAGGIDVDYVGSYGEEINITTSKTSRPNAIDGRRKKFNKALLANYSYTEIYETFKTNVFSFNCTPYFNSDYVDCYLYVYLDYIALTGLIIRNSQGIILRGKDDIILRDE